MQNISKVRVDNEQSPERNEAAVPPPTQPAIGANAKRRLRRRLFAIGPIVVAIIGAALYFTSGRYVSTDNAYLKANKVTISPEISGPIANIAVHENQQVKAGDELFRIDEQPFRIALERAEAQLHVVQLDIDGLKASYRQMEEQLRMANSNVQFAEREMQRQAQLAKQKLTPQAKLDEVQHNLDTARQQVAVVEQQRAQTLTRLAGSVDMPLAQRPSYMEAKAMRDSAALNLQHAIVRAPFAGVTSKVPQVGQYVNAGSAVMSVVATSELWIEANFMETDLNHVRQGQAVKIRIDTYSDRAWQGRVQSIAQATGAEFSVLPPQNATGNWVKVVQRIPVRIAIDLKSDDPPLRVGMTAFVEIDTGRHHSLSALLHLNSGAAGS